MKKTICIGFGLCLAAGLTGCEKSGSGSPVWAILLAVLGVLVLALAGLRTWQFLQFRKRMLKRKPPRRKIPSRPDNVTLILYGAAALLLILALLLLPSSPSPDNAEDAAESTTEVTEPPVVFAPEKTAWTDPLLWDVDWEIFDAGTLVSSYIRQNSISFGDPEDYFPLPGVATFRGNNYRNSATYGTATVTDQTLTTLWTTPTQALSGGEGGRSWSGSGWTGQPLIVQWDTQTRQQMKSMYTDKQSKDGLVEVIYATLDGHIYFLDLDDGSYTRDPITIGMPMKGAGSLDPRGYPLMYVGAGDGNTDGDRPKMFVISLIDGSILFEYGDNDPLALRRDNETWTAFDSAPLVDAETDTLIWPGENGLLYTFRLNTAYDKAAGTISVSPSTPVLTRYRSARSSADTYWLGYEPSASIIDRYLYISENGGLFFCIDLDTMELVWAQDTADDSNSSPVIERVAEDEAYIYTAPSLHWTQDSNAHGTINIYKLDALTGQIVWQTPFDVYTVSSLSGGVQSTPLLGKDGSSIDGLVIYSIARIPAIDSGILVALDTKTGSIVWQVDMDHYTWSSPVAFYEEDGTAYVAVCDSVGNVFLVEGASGQILNTSSVGSLVEASPAIYEDMLVIGTRGMLICGVQIK